MKSEQRMMDRRSGTAAAQTSLSVLALGLAGVLGFMWFGPTMGGAREAEAAVAAQVAGFTVLSSEVSNEEVVCVLDSRQAKGALQAANFWVWSGEGSLEAHLQRRSGNSKFREPVDHNGVLHSDQTTLSVIRKYNAQLARLVG